VVIGLIPAVVVGYSVLRNLTRSIDAWESPGVAATMEGVRMVARTSVNKLVANLSVHARGLITSDAFLEAASATSDSAGAACAAFRERTEVDLVALYTSEGTEWRERAVACEDSVHFRSSDIDLAIQLTSLQTDEHGYLVSAFPFDAGGRSHAVVLGYRLGPEYLPYLESIAAGLTYYSQLQLAKDVTRQTAALTAITVTLAAIALALFLGRRVARGVSRPVDDLVVGMQALARGEAAYVQPKGTDELRFLADAFNGMVRELEDTRRELAKAERLSAWQEMARRVAHEIRNPLTPIQFALHRLRRRAGADEPADPNVIEESVTAILEELDGLKALAATFSEFARLPDPEPVELQLNDLARSAGELASDQGAVVHCELAPNLPLVYGDRKGLRRVLTNLLKNALETGASRIELRTRLETGVRRVHEDDHVRFAPGSVRGLLTERHVVFTVEDNGPGIVSEALDKVFMPDYSTKATGTGLGLAITCRIIAQHGGALVVERVMERGGQGVRMHVHLPISRKAIPS
jgi:nitrogen fixation/metabolism regulation signal transduction histidine kinase